MLLGIVNFVAQAHAIVRRLVDAVPSGRYLVMSHRTMEVNGPAVAKSMRQWNESGAARSREEIVAFLPGLELLEPGVVTCSAWRPDPEHPGNTDKVSEFAAVARKP